jgi:hypothetical protein
VSQTTKKYLRIYGEDRKRKSITLLENIKDENFIKLMNYIFEKTNYFSLCKTKWNASTQIKILEELEL